MTQIKRKTSSSSERPCKKVRFTIDNEIVGVFDHQPSQLDASTIKSVNELSESEKNQWRRYSNPEDFFNYTGWDQGLMEEFKQSYYFDTGTGRVSFYNWLIRKAQGELSAVHHRLELLGMNEKINWIFIQPLYGSMKSITEDNMMYTCIQLKRINHSLHPTQDWKYADLLSRLLPRKKVQYGLSEGAFHSEERLTADGHRQSDFVCEKLLQYYNSYDPNQHAAPYASIVGGTAKSFMIQQLAVQHGIYIAYASLAHELSNAYPRRSEIADRFPKDGIRRELEKFWECYIVTSLADIEACRTAGITPAGFYNLQTKRPYYGYQKEFADRVMSLFNMYPRLRHTEVVKKQRIKVQAILSSRVDHAQVLLRRWRLELESNGDNCKIPSSQAGGVKPRALICVDEAHELFDNNSSFKFHAFRGAIRQRDLSRDLSNFVPQDGAFGVSIGTDHSMEERATVAIGVGKKMFPPITIPTI
ncbi:hypothetical protein SI65_09447 [Aspergillus cristatus]|uniref:Uncharacterized protein n=1 Tax=Aspergillus cristatus TaxID=573508 RepID=A0A1E3B2T2_ASPCR|nr:hypothetical protein SI65_09447 [Aspergillus cristatus]